MLPEPRLARQIIETLGQSGTPLSKGVSYYNVGNESLLNAIDTHYLGSYLADGGAVFKLVVGDYGSGKSHFLYCLRDRAWQRNFAVSKVDLSPKESPYDDQRRVYAAVASSIIWHELGDLGEDERGLSRFLEGTLRRIVTPHGLDLADAGAAEPPDLRALLQTLETTQVDSLSFHKAIQGYLNALLRGQEIRQESLGRWLQGEEGDRMLSVGGRSEKVATDNLREVIDRCREDLPGAMFVYAVPPAFITDIVPKYPALQQRVQSPSYFSRSNPFSPQISLDHLDIPDGELLPQIGARLLPIFEVAYEVGLDPDAQAANIDVLAEAALDSYLAISHRRLFIKALVTEWFRQKEEGQRVITPETAAAAIMGQSEQLMVLAGARPGRY